MRQLRQLRQLRRSGVAGAALRDNTCALLRLMRHNFGDRRWDDAEITEALDRSAAARAAERKLAGAAGLRQG